MSRGSIEIPLRDTDEVKLLYLLWMFDQVNLAVLLAVYANSS